MITMKEKRLQKRMSNNGIVKSNKNEIKFSMQMWQKNTTSLSLRILKP
jgi:hypothetical protein